MGKAENVITQVLERMLPVGSIVEWSPVAGGKTDLSTPDKVAAYYGFGAWEPYGSGRMLLGVSDSHAVGSTGGEEAHSLTAEELPNISVGIYVSTTAVESGGGSAARFQYDGYTSDIEGSIRGGGRTAPLGDGAPLPIMPPYITIYRWKRIA